MIKCLKYHIWVNTEAGNYKTQQNPRTFPPTYPEWKFDAPNERVLAIFLQNFQDIIFTPSRVDSPT